MKLNSILGAFAAAFVSIWLSGCASSLTSASTSGAAHPSGKAVKKVDFLFVQTAKGFSHENGRITLRDVNPLTISFSDRPDRIAGHMPTSKFVPMWSQGADSFLSNPPNATLSVFRGDAVSSTVVVLRNPRLVGEDLSYEVKVLEGTLPAQSGPCSLFIDIIGMPLTPFSYAGAARRAWRRGALLCARPLLSSSCPLLRPDSGPLRLSSRAPARRLVSGGRRRTYSWGLIRRRHSRGSKA